MNLRLKLKSLLKYFIVIIAVSLPAGVNASSYIKQSAGAIKEKMTGRVRRDLTRLPYQARFKAPGQWTCHQAASVQMNPWSALAKVAPKFHKHQGAHQGYSYGYYACLPL